MSSRTFGLVALAIAGVLVAFLATGCASDDKVEAALKDAQVAYDQGDFAESAQQLETLIEQKADDLDARRLYALVLAAQGENEKAIEQYAAVIKAEAEDHETLYRMALLERLIGKTESAIAHFEEAVEIQAEDTYVDELARTYMQVGKYAEAAKAWGSLLEDQSLALESRVEILKLQADAFQGAKDYDAARTALQEAVKLAPNDGDLKLKLEALGE